MSSVLHVPDEVAERLAAEAERRQVSVDDLATELVRAGLVPQAGEALDAFIGCGDSGDPGWASRDTHELRAEAAQRASQVA